jgi:LPXTG-motif cell wall-anchored protein
MKNKTLRNDLIILGILVVLIGGLFLFKSKQQGAKIVIKKMIKLKVIIL